VKVARKPRQCTEPPGEPLDRPVRYLKGVGPRLSADLARLGIATASDLLNWFPIRYADRGPLTPIDALAEGQPATVRAQIVRLWSGLRPGTRRNFVRARVEDASGCLLVTWFNAPYMADRLRVGRWADLSGRPRLDGAQRELVNPACRILEQNAHGSAAPEPPRYRPVYSAGGGLSSGQIARIIARSLEELTGNLPEWLPADALRRHGLMPRRQAYRAIHQPPGLDTAAAARRRLTFDECLVLQLAVGLRRWRWRETRSAPRLELTPRIEERIRARLPFALTAAQQRVVREVAADLGRVSPMARLLQGDVGSGKTIVAVWAVLQTIACRHQVAILAPTAVLAEQHFGRITAMLRESRVRCALLLGGGGRAGRSAHLKQLRAGALDLVIGTHALLEEPVVFARLGLVVIDEQHRFGVRQRAALLSKGRAPHCLVMTATPIPRTLMMTVFGDLDVSVIDELPPGRRTVETRVVDELNLPAVWQAVGHRLAAGQQAFIVYPLVEESDALPLGAAREEARRLQRGVFAGHRVGLLHGRMRPQEKHATMEAFHRGELAVLVCTTVVEVGVDVPTATVMVIRHADRYGLAQLHQLRGRIGRGHQPGLCFLVTDSRAPGVGERLDVLCRTSDGFVIAEEDLRLRGPGELLGPRQHGMPRFRLFRPLEDQEVFRAARAEANRILGDDPGLVSAPNLPLRKTLKEQYADALLPSAD